MQQEIQDIGMLVLAIGGTIAAGTFGAGVLAGFHFYGDAKYRYSLLDSTRQRELGKPKLLAFLAQDIADMPGSIFNSDYNVNPLGRKYFEAYLDTKAEQEQLEHERRYVFRK